MRHVGAVFMAAVFIEEQANSRADRLKIVIFKCEIKMRYFQQA